MQAWLLIFTIFDLGTLSYGGNPADLPYRLDYREVVHEVFIPMGKDECQSLAKNFAGGGVYPMAVRCEKSPGYDER